MRLGGFGWRLFAPLALLAALAASVVVAGPAQSTTPSLIWRGPAQIRILCLVQANGAPDERELENGLCARLRTLASAAAPVPVGMASAGDPALVDPKVVTLLVHASVSGRGGARLLAFTIRPHRPLPDPADILFGTAPRVVPIGTSGVRHPAMDPALRAALAEILPWQGQADRPQQISRR